MARRNRAIPSLKNQAELMINYMALEQDFKSETFKELKKIIDEMFDKIEKSEK